MNQHMALIWVSIANETAQLLKHCRLWCNLGRSIYSRGGDPLPAVAWCRYQLDDERIMDQNPGANHRGEKCGIAAVIVDS